MAPNPSSPRDDMLICRSDEDDDLDAMVSFLRQNRPDLVDAMKAQAGEKPERFFDEGDIQRHTRWFLKRVIRKITGSKSFKTPQQAPAHAKTTNRRPHHNELRELVATNSLARSRSQYGSQAAHQDVGMRPQQMHAPRSNHNAAANMMQPTGCGGCGQVHRPNQPCMSPYIAAQFGPSQQAYPVPGGIMYFPPLPPGMNIVQYANGYADPRLSFLPPSWLTSNASASPPDPDYYDPTQEMLYKGRFIAGHEQNSSEPAPRVRQWAKSNKRYESPYQSNSSSLASIQSVPQSKASWPESNETALRFDKMAFKSGSRSHKKYNVPRVTSQVAYEQSQLFPELTTDTIVPHRSTDIPGRSRAFSGVPGTISEVVELPETDFAAPQKIRGGAETPKTVSHALKKSSGNIANPGADSGPSEKSIGNIDPRPDGSAAPKSKKGKRKKVQAANASVKRDEKTTSGDVKLDTAECLEDTSNAHTSADISTRKEDTSAKAAGNCDTAAIPQAVIAVDSVSASTNAKVNTKKAGKQRATKKQPDAAKPSEPSVAHTPEHVSTAITSPPQQPVLAPAPKEVVPSPIAQNDEKKAKTEATAKEATSTKRPKQKQKPEVSRTTMIPAVPDLKLLQAKSPRNKVKPAIDVSSEPLTPKAAIQPQTQSKAHDPAETTTEPVFSPPKAEAEAKHPPKPHRDITQASRQERAQDNHDSAVLATTTDTPTAPTSPPIDKTSRSRRSSAVQILKLSTTRRLSESNAVAAGCNNNNGSSPTCSRPSSSSPHARDARDQIEADNAAHEDAAVVSSPSSGRSAPSVKGSPARRATTPESSILEEVQELMSE